jgi:hypothetical protein
MGLLRDGKKSHTHVQLKFTNVAILHDCYCANFTQLRSIENDLLYLRRAYEEKQLMKFRII